MRIVAAKTMRLPKKSEREWLTGWPYITARLNNERFLRIFALI
jgi:hypothetical protein